jgi:hypothetical protein
VRPWAPKGNKAVSKGGEAVASNEAGRELKRGLKMCLGRELLEARP